MRGQTFHEGGGYPSSHDLHNWLNKSYNERTLEIPKKTREGRENAITFFAVHWFSSKSVPSLFCCICAITSSPAAQQSL